MKITIELEGQVASVSNPNAITLPDALELCERVLLGAGFIFKGELQITEAEDSGLDE